MRESNAGFSLVELLVVASIIILMTVIASINHEEALQRSRDDERVATLHGLQQKLEQYYSQNGFYVCGESCPGSGNYIYDSSDVGSFLNGGDCCAVSGGTPATPDNQDGLYDQGYLTTPTIIDPLGVSNFKSLYYQYAAPKNGRQEYHLYTILESRKSLMLEDGGSCNNYYELQSERRSGQAWTFQPVGVSCN